MKKEAITVDKCTMFAATVPVKVLLDILRGDDSTYLIEIFRLLEIEDHYLVQAERYKVSGSNEMIYQCFTNEKDAWNYLEMYGVQKEQEEDREDSEREFGFD